MTQRALKDKTFHINLDYKVNCNNILLLFFPLEIMSRFCLISHFVISYCSLLVMKMNFLFILKNIIEVNNIEFFGFVIVR